VYEGSSPRRGPFLSITQTDRPASSNHRHTPGNRNFFSRKLRHIRQRVGECLSTVNGVTNRKARTLSMLHNRPLPRRYTSDTVAKTGGPMAATLRIEDWTGAVPSHKSHEDLHVRRAAANELSRPYIHAIKVDKR